MRRGGKQIVRHIHIVNRDGQAVIADVQTGGQQNTRIDDQPHATGVAGVGPALRGANPLRDALPIALRKGKRRRAGCTASITSWPRRGSGSR